MARMRRKFADVRKAAADKKAAAIRDQHRASYGRNLGKTKFAPIKKRAPSNRWDRKLGKWIRDKSGAGIGALTSGIKAMDDLILTPMRKAAENKKIMGSLYKDKKSMDRLRESLMTPKNKEFYDKYIRLADLATDNQEKDRLMGIANTALRNAQISSRINYGLGQLGYDTIGKEPFESYTKPMFGEETARFNMDNFTGGLRGTKAGKDFYNAALAAHATEKGDSMIGNALVNQNMIPPVDPAIMNYRDPIRDMVEPTGTGQSMVADLNPRIPYKDTYHDVSISDIPPELFIDKLQHYVGREGINEQRKGYTADTAANMQGYLYGEPGALFGDPAGTYLRESSGSPYDTGARSPLHGIFPNYEVGHPILSTSTAFGDLENMGEQELLDWGSQNPSDAKLLGFNPYYSDMWLD